MPCLIQTMVQELAVLKVAYLVLKTKFCPHNLLDHTNIQQLMEELMHKGTLEESILLLKQVQQF